MSTEGLADSYDRGMGNGLAGRLGSRFLDGDLKDKAPGTLCEGLCVIRA